MSFDAPSAIPLRIFFPLVSIVSFAVLVGCNAASARFLVIFAPCLRVLNLGVVELFLAVISEPTAEPAVTAVKLFATLAFFSNRCPTALDSL